MVIMQHKMDFVNNWLLMSTPVSPAVILATYLMFVLKIGPNYMKDRKPFQLQNIITFYNAVQVVISCFLLYVTFLPALKYTYYFASFFGIFYCCAALDKCTRMLAIYGFVPKTCCLETEESRQGIAAAMHYYLLAKISELLDTIFFVLRKKDRQLTFLHIYHHTLMIFVTWTALKYEPSINLMFLGVVNSFVHIIMYGYYGLSSFPSLTKFLWWKKYITSLQLAQFVIVFTQFLVAAAYSECTPSYVLLGSLTVNTFFFLYLFGTFYLNNYTKKTSKVSKLTNETEINNCKNSNGDLQSEIKDDLIVKNGKSGIKSQ